MKYDFTNVQQAMAERGLTLVELAALTRGAVTYSTICKAFQRGTASQKTAKALVKALRIPMRTILCGEKTA